jgi:hypothetical protein
MSARKGPPIKPGNGRAKGGGFEATVALLFTQWWSREGVRFMRTDALQTLTPRDRVVFGDIVPVMHNKHSYDLDFPFSVECKADESLDLWSLVKSTIKSPVELWWEQCTRDAGLFSRIPLLVMKKNYCPILCVFPTYTESRLIEFVRVDVWVKGFKTMLGDDAVFITELSGLFARYSPMWKASLVTSE